MKRSIPLLIIIGVAAALCAAVLVTSLRTGGGRSHSTPSAVIGEVAVLLADRDMKAMTVLDSEDLTTTTIRSDRAPHQHLSNAIEVVGKVLAVPVRKGQALTRDVFVTKGAGVHLASTLQKGMRAMSVSLADYSGLDGLLYPGAVVDVLATFRRSRSESAAGEPVSTSLLRGVMVLAVGAQSVVSDTGEMPALGKLSKTRRRLVTLMITPKQAEVLQLAAEHGTVSLSLRNPTDGSRGAGGLTALGELFGKDGPSAMDRAMDAIRSRAWMAEPVEADPAAVEVPTTPTPAIWNVTVLRGGQAEVMQFQTDTENDGQVTSR